jgi:Holliday junction resolvasome RuvABC endonuclease subunit
VRIVAFDLSLTSTGWASAHNGVRAYGRIDPCNATAVNRLVFIRTALLQKTQLANLVVLEGYSFGSVQQAHRIGELGGVVRVALHEAGVPVAEIAPASLKRYATGRGNAGKAEVLVAAVKRLGYDGASSDEADALWLLAMALDHYGVPGKVDMPQQHRTALEKVAWPTREAVLTLEEVA